MFVRGEIWVNKTSLTLTDVIEVADPSAKESERSWICEIFVEITVICFGFFKKCITFCLICSDGYLLLIVLNNDFYIILVNKTGNCEQAIGMQRPPIRYYFDDRYIDEAWNDT